MQAGRAVDGAYVELEAAAGYIYEQLVVTGPQSSRYFDCLFLNAGTVPSRI